MIWLSRSRDLGISYSDVSNVGKDSDYWIELGRKMERERILHDCRRMDVGCTCDTEEEGEVCNFCRIVQQTPREQQVEKVCEICNNFPVKLEVMMTTAIQKKPFKVGMCQKCADNYEG
jgi:hypothetical protein